jgi:hypothetical protein
VKFDPKKVVALYRTGKSVAQIAHAMGYPKGSGNNRTRNVLIKAGLYKPAKRSKKSPRK